MLAGHPHTLMLVLQHVVGTEIPNADFTFLFLDATDTALTRNENPQPENLLILRASTSDPGLGGTARVFIEKKSVVRM